MTSFAELQSRFQTAILERDDGVLAELLDGANERRGPLFDVYRNAYVQRLVEVIRKDHAILHAFLADDTFDEVATAYIAAYPSRHPSVRWVARHLPTFLAETEPYSAYPVVAELAGLEKAINDAFDAADGDVLTGADLAAIPPDSWHDLVVEAHPAARRLSLATNAAAIWSALHQDEAAPEPETLAAPCEILVWRSDGTPMWRELPREEATMWDAAAAGVPFGQLCVMLATIDDPDTAAVRAAGYLGGWVQSGLLSAARLVATTKEASARSM